ncbi:hypothetical protein [Pseudomonas sp. N2-5-1-1]
MGREYCTLGLEAFPEPKSVLS